MVRERPSKKAQWIKEQVRQGRYVMADHAVGEMGKEGMEPKDLEEIVVEGRLARTMTADARGRRFLFRDTWGDAGEFEVVARVEEDQVRIVTVYRVEFDEGSDEERGEEDADSEE